MLSCVCSGDRDDGQPVPVPSQTGGTTQIPTVLPGNENTRPPEEGPQTSSHPEPHRRALSPGGRLPSQQEEEHTTSTGAPYLPLICAPRHSLWAWKRNMQKPADTQKQCTFSKYSFLETTLTTHTKTFTKEKQPTFWIDDTKVPIRFKPQRTCLDVNQGLWSQCFSWVKVPLTVPGTVGRHLSVGSV